MPRAQRLRAAAARLAWILSLGSGAAIALAFAAWALPSLWILDLFGHLRVHYALVLVVAALLALAGQSRRGLGLAIALLVADLAPLAPLYVGRDLMVAGPTLRVVHFNVLSSNRSYDEVAAWMADSGADLIFAQEVSPEWARALARIPGYQLARSLPRLDNFGIAVLVRHGAPIASTGVVELEPGLPALRVDATLGDRSLRLLSVHTLPPVSGVYAATRDRQLAAAGAWARVQRGEGAAPVVIGDLNATPWSARLRALIGDAELINSQRGFGLQASWPALGWFGAIVSAVGIPIDHCLHDRALVTRERVIGPFLGSDHLPLIVDLAFAAAVDP